jgi:hypothetical protein
MGDDLTVEILKQIRDGVNATNRSVDSLREEMATRLGRVEARLEGMETRLGRVEDGLTDLGNFMRQIALDQAKYERFHAHHVEVLEKDMEDLRLRVRRLEEGAAK